MATANLVRPETSRVVGLHAVILILVALLTFSATANAQDQVTLLAPCIDGLFVDANGVATPGNLVSSISWSWGDGSTTVGFFPQTHTYASGGSYTITVTAYYTEGSPASQSETVTVGTGVLTGCPVVSLSSTSLLFATEAVGKTSPPQTVTLTNTGTTQLEITSITASTNFEQTSTCGSGVSAGASCTITVTFAPQITGHQVGLVSIVDNAFYSPQTISLAESTAVVLAPSKLSWGTQQTNVTSAPQNLKLTNTAETVLSSTSIKITGSDKNDFAQANNCGTSLPGGASCTIAVTFTPAAAGGRSGDISISDSSGGTQGVSLSGVGAQLAAGTLAVTISGLPSGTAGMVTVSGPAAFTPQTLTETTTLTGLVPGTYTIVGTVVQSASATNTVYVPSVTGASAIVTESGGAAATVSYSKLVAIWKKIGPSAIPISGGFAAAGKLQAFAVSNSNPLLMYAGGGIGPGNSGPYTEAGVYKTKNGGTTWSQQNNGLTDPSVNVLWMDQGDTSIVVAGTNFTGIFRTSNAGASWTQPATGALGSTSALLEVSGVLYAGTAQGIYSSNDTGQNWQPVLLTEVPVRALAQQGGITYAGLDNGEVLIQAVPGGSWTPYTPASNTVWALAINPNTPQNAFAVEWMGYQSPDIYETQNGGAAATWLALSDLTSCPLGPDVGLQAQMLAFESESGTLYAGCDGYSSAGSPLWESSNDAGSWSNISAAGEWDIRLIDPDAEGVVGNIVVGSDQGLYFSNNGGSTWQSLNGNIMSSILYSVGVAGNTIFAAAQDFGPIYSYNAGATWSTGIGGGEGGTVVFNPANPAYVYSFTTAGLQLSGDGGQTYSYAAPLSGIEFVGGSDNPTAIDPNSASTVYAPTVSGIYQSTDWGVSWTLESSWPFGSSASVPNTPQVVAVSPASSQTIFVGANNLIQCDAAQSLLCYTTDGGSTWQASNLPSDCGTPVAIAIDPANPQIVLAGMNGVPILSCGILRSTDGGANFSASTAGLSSRQQGCNTNYIPHLQVDPGSSGAVAAATPNGVYISTDFGLNWTSIRGNTVPLSVTEAIWSGGHLYESTCGEGVLRISFPF